MPDKWGWTRGKIYDTKVHKFNEKYILSVADKGGAVFNKTYNTKSDAEKEALSYRKAKRRGK